MYSELTNLLPQERQRALSRDYFFRLSVVFMLFLTALTLAATVLLIPTYVLLVRGTQVNQTRLANVQSRIASSDEAALSERLTALANDATTLASLARTPSISATLRTVLAISRPGVTLSSLAYTSAVTKSTRTISISGTAVTRDALRQYQLALQSAPGVSSADLPVSAYAKDSDISFTIMVTLAL